MTESVRAPHLHHAGRRLRQVPALLAMLALLSAWAPTAARADGDPASDVLATQRLFLPQDAAVPPAQQVQLGALLGEAARGGFPIRVALIASATDLGSVTALWKQPQNYARFLGQELGLVYGGPLLVVMPSGFGLYHLRHPSGGERALTGGPNPRAGVGAAAITAIRNLAAAAGHPLALPSSGATHAGATTPGPTPWIALAVGALLIAAAWTASVRARPLSLARRRPGSRSVGQSIDGHG